MGMDTKSLSKIWRPQKHRVSILVEIVKRIGVTCRVFWLGNIDLFQQTLLRCSIAMLLETVLSQKKASCFWT